ncbi:MAG: hypothetical protein ACFE94_02865 [Candidatus Hodarchaeota archaeon]
MSKAVVSYYDWKLSFNKKINSSEDELKVNEHVNTLGISEYNFKDFIKKWKEKNFS